MTQKTVQPYTLAAFPLWLHTLFGKLYTCRYLLWQVSPGVTGSSQIGTRRLWWLSHWATISNRELKTYNQICFQSSIFISGQGKKKQFERWLRDKKVPEYVTMRKETVDLSIRSWLCSTQVGSSSAVNLQLDVNRLEIGLINLILGGI